MGYNVYYSGDLTITPPLNEADAAIVTAILNNRKTDALAVFQSMQAAIPKVDLPWCSGLLSVSEDRSKLLPEEDDSKYGLVDWLQVLRNHFLGCAGYVLNGSIGFEGEDPQDRGTIFVQDSVIEVVDDRIFNPGPSWEPRHHVTPVLKQTIQDLLDSSDESGFSADFIVVAARLCVCSGSSCRRTDPTHPLPRRSCRMAVPALQAPVLPFTPQSQPERKTAPEPSPVTSIDAGTNLAADHTLLQIDRELDLLFDRMQDELEETGAAGEESVALFHTLCDAFGDKVDRIGRFIRVMEAREAYCKTEAARLTARAKASENKVAQAKNLVLYYLNSRGIAKMEGKQFTLRSQKNAQDSVTITDETQIPFHLKRVAARYNGGDWEQILQALPEAAKPLLTAGIHEVAPVNDAIKRAVAGKEEVPGATVSRGHHVRIA